MSVPQPDLGDPGDDRVEEEAIVRDEDHGVRIAREVLLEPVARVEVEVVRRFVEQQQAGASEQQLGERDAHLPAARERLARLVHVRRGESQAAQHGRDLQLDAVALAPAEFLLQLAVARQHRRVLRLGAVVVAELILERRDLVAHVEQRLEREPRLLPQRAAGVMEAVLREVADRQAGRLDDEPPVGLVDARQHLQECRLAGTVRAAESDTLAVVDLPVDGIEEHAVAERLGQG